MALLRSEGMGTMLPCQACETAYGLRAVATYHTNVVFAGGGETWDADVYTCAEHTTLIDNYDAMTDTHSSPVTEVWDLLGLKDQSHNLFAKIEVVEVTQSELAGEC